jgi:pyruvate dehydrogenase E2 component (dihydrolipoamide acetyltransferase)
MAKSLAAERGIDLSQVTGTGPEGRITAADVESFKGAGAAKADKPKKEEGPKIDRTGGGVIPAGTVTASPQAKKAAKKMKVDINKIQGTGNFGRVTEEDVLKAAGKAPAAPAKAYAAPTRDIPELPDGPVPLSGMQNAVAANMMKTMESPSFRVSRKIETGKFDELYAALKPRGMTVSALLSRAVALAIEKHPIINAHYDDKTKSIVYKKDINIANAVAIDGGLITPVIQNCNMKDITTVSGEWKDLVGKAKSGTLSPAEYNSGTFTISNLGMFGVSQFGSLLPAGSGSILAIGGATEVVKMRNGVPTAVKEMEVTITCDHRHIYGADAALFLKTLAEILEQDTLSIAL